jgi:phage terminase large subunit
MKDEEQREQIRSIGQEGGLDIIWGEEANKLLFEDHQELLPRLRGKAGPYRQLIYTTNPDAPGHWINENLIIGGGARVWYSSANDNPFNAPEYLQTLALLVGIQRERLVLGRWVQAEGVIYDNFDVLSNVAPVEYDPARSIMWSLDDGYATGSGPGTASYHPRVALIAQEDGRGGVNILDERYATNEASYDQTIDALLAMPYAPPELSYVDSSAAMLRGALAVRNITNTGATHPVIEGIRNVRRMIRDGNGVSLIHIHPRCVKLIRELQMYRYEETAQIAGDRKPAKVDDHGPDCLRYLCWHLRYEGSV